MINCAGFCGVVPSSGTPFCAGGQIGQGGRTLPGDGFNRSLPSLPVFVCSVANFQLPNAVISESPVFSLHVSRQQSASPRAQRMAFGILAMATGVIAGGFLIVGAWMIVPFAGLELAALYLAFRWQARHAHDFERIRVEGDLLVVESRRGAQSSRLEFNRCWAQVVIEGSPAACRVKVRSHGREVVFGSDLGHVERYAAAQRLRRELARP